MSTLIAIVVALLLLAASGSLVGVLVKKCATEPEKPPNLPTSVWNSLARGSDQGLPLGIMERWLLFAAFFGDAVPLAAAWLAFKLASKWEVWKNIVRVPDEVEGMSHEEWFAFTHGAGSWILQKFWVGTLANLLLALGAAALARHLPQLQCWCP